MDNQNTTGPNTEPCGTPMLTFLYEEDSLFILTKCNLSQSTT